MACGCEWTKNIKILAARARVSTTFDTATSRLAGRRERYLERPSTKPQGIAHVISSATSFTKKGETIY